jgi:serine protease Do
MMNKSRFGSGAENQRDLARIGSRDRRSLAILIGALALSLGIIIGLSIPRARRVVVAGNTEPTNELSAVFVDIARKVEPSVVNISTVIQPSSNKPVKDRVETFDNQIPFDLLPFGRDRARRGNGSGVIVDRQGYILTNHHVIAGADRIRVKLYDGTELPGRVIGSDQETDLAVVKVLPTTVLEPARLGDSDRARVGDWVLAIGSPFGLDQTVTAGIISAKDREANELNSRPSFQHFLQTDAAINRGNSGGPLINLEGEVIGINTAIATTTGDYNGIGFALPMSEANSIYRQLTAQGRVIRGFLGVVTDPVTPQIARVYGFSGSRGAIVSIVSETMKVDGRSVPTPASRAGLRLGDIITDYRGERIKNNLDLIRRVASTPVGTNAPLRIFRDGRELTLSVTIDKRPGESGSFTEARPMLDDADRDARRGIGLDVSMLPSPLAREMANHDVRGVIVVNVDPGSLADDAELRREDIVEYVNRVQVTTFEQFQNQIDRLKTGDPIVLQVYRRRSPAPRRFVSFNKP